MRLSTRWRKALLITHVVSSVGWLGADAVLLLLTATGLSAPSTLLGLDVGPVDPVLYPAAWFVGIGLLTPLSLAAWLSGVGMSVWTRWGLVRHWWVVVKLASTTVMLGAMLLVLLPSLHAAAQNAITRSLADQDRRQLVVAPTVACLLLLANTVISVYKPWGRARKHRRVPIA
jgi:hypothetical protein